MAHKADGTSVSGRGWPRPSGPPVAHEIRYAPQLIEDEHGDGAVLVVSCGNPACDYRLVMGELYYTLEQLTRLAVMHESGSAP